MGKRNGTGTPRLHGQSDTPLYNLIRLYIMYGYQ